MSSPPVTLDGVEVSVDHLIGGQRVSSRSTFESRSPLDWDWKRAELVGFIWPSASCVGTNQSPAGNRASPQFCCFRWNFNANRCTRVFPFSWEAMSHEST